MDHIFLLEQLDIIGCKEVPVRQPAMPRLLSVIFAVRGLDTVLFPPYTLGEQEVIRPDVSTKEEFDDLVACNEVSEFGPVPALPEHELWLDDTGSFHYEPGYLARKKLDSIFKTRCGSADWALKSGSLPEARTHAMVAYSANPRSLTPLLYRAAAEHQMILNNAEPGQIRVELALTEILAKSHLPIPDFKNCYLALARNRPENRGKFTGIAAKKPAPSKVNFQELACA